MGVGRTDPRQAVTLLRAVPEVWWRSAIRSGIESAIEAGGIGKSEEVYKILQADAETPSELLRKAMDTLMERRTSVAVQTGDFETLLAWFDSHFPQDTVDDRRDRASDLLGAAF